LLLGFKRRRAPFGHRRQVVRLHRFGQVDGDEVLFGRTPFQAWAPLRGSVPTRGHLLQDLIGQRRVAAPATGVEHLPELWPAQGGKVDLRHR
jgi:hypothetical protein